MLYFSFFSNFGKSESTWIDLLDPSHWKTSFRRMINKGEEELNERLSAEFARRSRLRLEFTREALLQLQALDEIIKDPNSLNAYIRPWDKTRRTAFYKYINGIAGQLKVKVPDLIKSQTPPGYEVLHSYIRGGSNCSSIEVGKNHRVIYRLDSHASCIRIYSILFHYEDSPMDEFDVILYEMVKETQLDINSSNELIFKWFKS